MNTCNKFISAAILCSVFVSTMAQSKHGKPLASLTIPLKSESWQYTPNSAEFNLYKSRPSIKLLTSGDPVVLKDFDFTNGTIEYDLEPLDPNFTSIYFRKKDKESECFYFRTKRTGDSQAIDGIQYAPILDDVNMWDMLFHFQTCADFKKEDWNHVKLVISGKQMRVFVNTMTYPVLEVPILEGNVNSGTLAFEGQVIISNLIVKPNIVEGLSPEPGIDPVANDPRYIRKWQVSEPLATDKGIDFKDEYAPKPETKWEAISAERCGLVNLTRKFGKTTGRRIVWLKTTITSEKDQNKMLRFGFSDEVWVMINNKPLYLDKNLYNTPMAKIPDGRCAIENSTIRVPLKKGENQLMVGVANFFYGWGIVARFDDLGGIQLEK